MKPSRKTRRCCSTARLKRAKTVALSLGIAAVILIIFFIFAVVQRIEADRRRGDAEKQRVIAEQAKDDAQLQRDIAVEQTLLANRSLVRSQVAQPESSSKSILCQISRRNELKIIYNLQYKGRKGNKRSVKLVRRSKESEPRIISIWQKQEEKILKDSFIFLLPNPCQSNQ